MSIKKETKTKIIQEFSINEKDTGSVEVQCAVLTERVKNLTDHLKTNKKDISSKRGLLMLVSRRRKLLRYLEQTNKERYLKLIKILGLKPNK